MEGIRVEGAENFWSLFPAWSGWKKKEGLILHCHIS